jgi:hypothetical protein
MGTHKKILGEKERRVLVLRREDKRKEQKKEKE